ncbi:hypothetical protein, partial [Brucella sp. 09RB8913]
HTMGPFFPSLWPQAQKFLHSRRTGRAVKIIPAKERGSVDIPLSDLVHHGGELKIRPDLIRRGLVELRQSSNKLQLEVNGVVGRIPVTSGLALDVQPKFSISNLNRIVYSSATKIENPFFISRPYSRTKLQSYLPVPLIKSFTTSLQRAVMEGIHREYSRTIKEASPRPKLNFIKSDQRFWSKMIPTKAVVESFDFSSDNLANQTLKLAAHKALSLSKTIRLLNECTPQLASALRQLERVTLRDAGDIFTELGHVRGTVPSFRVDYSHALTHAIEILRHTDVSLNVASEGLSLESYIISLDDAYERYLRHVLRTLKHPIFGTVTCVDGNIAKHQKRLFRDNNSYKVKPDLIFRSSGGTLLIADAKYKGEAKEDDRYQIIAHAVAYAVPKAVLVYPRRSSQSRQGLVRLGATGQAGGEVEIYEYYFDLDADLDAEEERLLNSFEGLIV